LQRKESILQAAKDGEGMVLEVAEEDEAMVPVPVYQESIHELLQISSNNAKATGTALTRLKNIMEYFGLKVPTKDNEVISFFLDMTPKAVESYGKYVRENLGRSPSTVYSILIGRSLFIFIFILIL
jgi:hypothetical protein